MSEEEAVAQRSISASDIRTQLAIARTLEAEKRTHLAELRTGIGILTIPMSLLTILIATSRYYSVQEVLVFIIGLIFGILGLAVVGAYLVIRALSRVKKGERVKQETCIDTEDIARKNGRIKFE